MILVVASRVDDVAERLLSALPDDAALLTSVDLSQPAWSVRPREASSSFVAGGQKLESARVRGVVGMLPSIFEQELVDIAPDDRAYVAAEMTAFLVYWLSTLDCPKLNRPTAGCLSGPNWRPERWVVEAAGAGLKVEPLRRGTRTPDVPGSQVTRGSVASSQAAGRRAASIAETADGIDSTRRFAKVTVVGDVCLGAADAPLQHQARALASATGFGLLEVEFVDSGDGFRFRGAEPFPEMSQPGMGEAVRAFFEGAGRR